MMNKKTITFLLLVSALQACSTGKDVLKKDGAKVYTTTDYYNLAMEQAVIFEKSGYSDNKSYNAAEGYFNKAIAIEKGDPDIWFNMGRVYFYSGEYSRSRECFKNAIKYRKSFVEAYSMLAKSYINDGNKDNALAVMLKASEVLPESDTVTNNTALVYTEIGNFNYAKKLAEKIIRRNPKYIPAYITLGNIYYLQKNYEFARLIYMKALDEGGDSGDIYTNLGLVVAKIEGKDRSYELLKRGIEKSPNNPYAHLNLGEFLLSSGDYDGAVSELRTSLKINPRLVEALVNIGAAYTNLKLFEEAQSSYEKALLYDPSYAETYFNYGILLSDHMLKPEEALAMFKKYVAIKSGELKMSHPVYRYIDDINKRVKG